MSQHTYWQKIGFLPPRAGTGISNISLNAAANWFAVSFVPDADRIVSAVNFVFRALTGSLGANDVSCTIYSDSGINTPNAAISAASTTVTPSLTTGNLGLLVKWTGFSQAVLGGTMYWAVLKNLNGSPAANFPNWRFTLNGTVSEQNRDFIPANTVNSGGVWTLQTIGAGGWRVDYADGASDGAPFLLISFPSTGLEVFGTREAGMHFTLPPDVSLRVRGIAISPSKVGAPPGQIRFRLYNDTTLLGTTFSCPVGRVPVNPASGGDLFNLWFPAPIVVPAGAIVRGTVATTTGGDASNYYQAIPAQISNDAVSKSMLPFAYTGGIKFTYFNGSSWSENDTLIPHMALILDNDAEFNAPWSRRPGGIMGGLQ